MSEGATIPVCCCTTKRLVSASEQRAVVLQRVPGAAALMACCSEGSFVCGRNKGTTMFQRLGLMMVVSSARHTRHDARATRRGSGKSPSSKESEATLLRRKCFSALKRPQNDQKSAMNEHKSSKTPLVLRCKIESRASSSVGVSREICVCCTRHSRCFLVWRACVD